MLVRNDVISLVAVRVVSWIVCSGIQTTRSTKTHEDTRNQSNPWTFGSHGVGFPVIGTNRTGIVRRSTTPVSLLSMITIS